MIVNPFPGPQPYRAADRNRFYGRDGLIKKLANQILARSATTVFGPSGAGKSSLLQAGVIPRLEDSDDIRLVRVDAWPTAEIPLQWLVQTLVGDLELGLENTAPSSIEALQRALDLAKRQSERALLIYLDQFEQVFIANHDEKTMKELLDGLTWLIHKNHGRDVHLVLSLREDYLGRLRDFSRDKPELTAHGFRVGPLTVKEMIQAMCRTALDGEPAQTWAADSMQSLMLDVRVPGQRASDDAEVQAAFAQIICRAIWEERAAGKTVDLQHANAETILHRYMTTTLAELGPLQDAALRLLEEHLIDDLGQRTLLTEKEAQTILPAEHATAILAQLERSAILHAEEHQGSRYFELGHDWLAKKVYERRIERKKRTEEETKAAQLQAERSRFRRKLVYISAATMVLAAITLVAVGQKFAAEKARQEAEASKALAQDRRDEAIRAQESAVRASKMATSRELMLRGQHDLATLILREVDTPESTAGWMQSAIDVLNVRVPYNTLKFPFQEHPHRWSHDGSRVVTFAEDHALHIFHAWNKTDPVVIPVETHTAPTVYWSPDDRFLLTTTFEGTAYVQASNGSGKPVVLKGQTGALSHAAWSPNGKRIATASTDGTVRIWNADGSGTPILHEFGAYVKFVAWNPTGTHFVASVSGHGSIVRSAENTVGLLGGIPNLEEPVVEWSPDGTQIAGVILDKQGADSERQARIVIGQSLTIGFGPTIEIGKGAPLVARWSPDGKFLVAAIGHLARIVRADGTGESIELKGHKERITDVAWSPDGRKIATTSLDKTIRVWNASGQNPGLVLAGHTDSVIESLVWSEDSQRLLTTGADDTARVWNVGSTVRPVTFEHNRKIEFASFSADGNFVMLTDPAEKTVVWYADGSREAFRLGREKATVYLAAWNPQGKTIATIERETTRVERTGPNRLQPAVGRPRVRPRNVGAFDAATEAPIDSERSVLAIWNIEDPKRPNIVSSFAEPIASLAWSPNGQHIAVDAAKAHIHVFDANGKSARRKFEPADADELEPAWSPDNRHLATVSTDGKVQIWNADSGDKPVLLEGNSMPFSARAWSPDGRRFAATTVDRRIIIWNIDVPSKPLILRGHQSAIEGLAWNPDGSRIATIAADGTLGVWKSAGDEHPAWFHGHESGHMSMVQWSPDGRHLLTSSTDKTARIWNADDPSRNIVLRSHADAVTHAYWSADGKRVLTVSDDRTAKIWLVDVALLHEALRSASISCLTTTQRQEFLLETEIVAKERYQACIKAQPEK